MRPADHGRARAISMIAVLVLGVVLVATTGGLLAATARPSTAVSYLLGTYLAGWATVVLSVAFLSAMGWLGRAGLLTTLVLALASAIVVWSIGGRPRPPVSRSTWVKFGRTLNDPCLPFSHSPSSQRSRTPPFSAWRRRRTNGIR